MHMDSILESVNRELVSALSDALPALSDNWWELYVLDQLTSNQARHVRGATPNLKLLDLAAALRVFTRNFVEISTKRDLSRDCKSFAFQVIDIRNRYAHRSTEATTAEDKYRDLDTLERFIILLKAPEATVRVIRKAKQTALLQLTATEPTRDIPQSSTPVHPNKPKASGVDGQLTKNGAIALLRRETSLELRSRDITFSNVNATSGNWWFEPALTAFEKDRLFLLNDHTRRVLFAFSVPASIYVPADAYFYVRRDTERCQIYVSPADTKHFADIHPSGPRRVRFAEHLVRRIQY